MSYSTRAKNEFKAGSKNGSKWIPLEKFVPFKIYAITFSPNNDSLADKSNRALSTFHFALISEWNAQVKAKYYILPEFGDNGNLLHYHGIIAFPSGMEYIRFRDYFKNTHIDIEKIGDPYGWLKYMTKQWKHLKKVFFVPFTNCAILQDWYESQIFCVSQAKLILDITFAVITERYADECDER